MLEELTKQVRALPPPLAPDIGAIDNEQPICLFHRFANMFCERKVASCIALEWVWLPAILHSVGDLISLSQEMLVCEEGSGRGGLQLLPRRCHR